MAKKIYLTPEEKSDRMEQYREQRKRARKEFNEAYREQKLKEKQQ